MVDAPRRSVARWRRCGADAAGPRPDRPRGRLTVLDGVDLRRRPRAAGRAGRPERVGKSTLLRALAGMERARARNVERTPPSATVGYLPQEPARSPTRPCRASSPDGPAWPPRERRAQRRRRRRSPPANGRGRRPLRQALDRWLALGGADLDARMGEVRAELGLGARLSTADGDPVGRRGGASRTGGAAARRFDVYLLDEPTNDLDLDGLDRLERWITGSTPASRSSATTAVPRPHGHPRGRARRVQPRATRFAGGWAGVPRRAPGRAAPRVGALRDVRHKRRACRPGPAGARVGDPGVAKVQATRRSNDKNIRPFQINQTEQLAGRAARPSGRSSVSRSSTSPGSRGNCASVGRAGRSGDVVVRLGDTVVERGEFRLGPIDMRSATASGSRGRRQRRGQDDVARCAARPRRWLRARARWARPSWSARSSRPVISSKPPPRCCGRSWTTRLDPSIRGRCWPSSGWSPITSIARPSRCRR